MKKIMQEFLMKDNNGIFYELKEKTTKTAMQLMVERIEFVFQKELKDEMQWWDNLKKGAIKMEKEQIIEAFEDGYKSCDIDEAFEINRKLASGELYYDKTYN
jgi:hypothetical protein